MEDRKVIITIGRQFGSGGRVIGHKLAERLGIAYYDKELITLASKESGICGEFFDFWMNSLANMAGFTGEHYEARFAIVINNFFKAAVVQFFHYKSTPSFSLIDFIEIIIPSAVCV